LNGKYFFCEENDDNEGAKFKEAIFHHGEQYRSSQSVVLALSSTAVAGNMVMKHCAVEGNQGTIVAISTGTVQTRKTVMGAAVAKASEIDVDKRLCL